MTIMAESERIDEMYVKSDTLTTRMDLHDKYSVNKYGFGNWIFDQYILNTGTKVLELGCGTANIWKGRESRLPGNVDTTSNLILTRSNLCRKYFL